MPKYPMALFAAAALAGSILPAHAAGPYDGRWVVDFPPVDVRDASNPYSLCGAMRIVGEVKDNRLTADLQRSTTTGVVENSTAANAVPVKGVVQPDGTVIASWENFPITGRLATDNTGEISVKSECGPRSGRAIRVQ